MPLTLIIIIIIVVNIVIVIFTIIDPLITRIVEAAWMMHQPAFSIVSFSPLPSRTCKTPGLSTLCY